MALGNALKYITKASTVVSSKSVSIFKQAQNFLKQTIDGENAIVSIFDNTGIAGFQFNVPQMEQVKLSNEITDYYSDNNTVFQDHIAYKPVIVTLSGLQGEYFYSVHRIKDTISAVTTTLKLVKEMKPELGNVQAQLREKWDSYLTQRDIAEVKNTLNANTMDYLTGNTGLSLKDKAGILYNQFRTYNGVDLFKLFQDLYKFKSAQTRAYLFFETLRKADKPFTVETRWKRFENMYIQDVTATADDSADITDIQVTFKQMYFTNSMAIEVNAAGRTQQEYWKETNKGLDKGQKVETIKNVSTN